MTRTTSAIVNASATRIIPATSVFISFLLLLLRGPTRAALLDLLLEVRVGQPDVVDPGETHVVNRTLTEPCPVARIGIVAVRCRVVVPTDHVKDRVRRQQRLNIFAVVINNVPTKLVVVDTTQHLLPAIGIDGFHALRLAAVVQVRLKRRDARVFGETREAVRSDVVRAGGDVEI